MIKRYDRMMKIVGWVIILLGFTHLSVTPVVMSLTQNLHSTMKDIFIFMYLATGVGTLLPGLIIVILSDEIAKYNKKAMLTGFICSLYLFIFGGGAIAFMPDNPFSYITLVIALGALFAQYQNALGKRK